MVAKVLVIGDLMMDEDAHYRQVRIAPEGCPVVEYDRLRSLGNNPRPGGASAVAAMAMKLGASVWLAGLACDTGKIYAAGSGVCVDAVIDRDDGIYLTTTKRRVYIDGKLAWRIDQDLSVLMQGKHFDKINAAISSAGSFSAVLVADHGKGVINPESWEWITRRFAGVPIIVDPVRGKSPRDYTGATAIVANREEAGGLGNVSLAEWRARQWIGLFPSLAAAVIKLDRDGFVGVTRDGESRHDPSLAEHVVDVVGAGDAFLAAMGVAVAEGRAWMEAAAFGNAAAAAKCAKLGAVPVSREEVAAVEMRYALAR